MSKLFNEIKGPFPDHMMYTFVTICERAEKFGVSVEELVEMTRQDMTEKSKAVTPAKATIHTPRVPPPPAPTTTCPKCGADVKRVKVNTGTKCTAVGGGYTHMDICSNRADRCQYTELFPKNTGETSNGL